MSSTFFDGKDPWGKPVSVELEEGFLKIYTMQGALEAKWEARQTSRMKLREEEGEWCLTLGGVARLVLRDKALQEKLSAEPKQLYSFLPDFIRRDRKVIFYTSLTVLAVGLFFWQGSHWLSKGVVALVPYEVDEKLGKLAFAESIKGKKVCKNQRGVAALKQLQKRMLGAEFSEVKVVVVKEKEVNAAAMPGGMGKEGSNKGYIIIFSGLLDSAHDQDVLAGVLAHEAGHIAYRHGTQRLISTATFAVLSAIFFGDVSGLGGVAIVLGSNTHTRSMEEEADSFALELMREKKVDSTPAARWFEKLAKKQGEKGIFSYFSTHPHSSDRADFFDDERKNTKELLSPSLWVALKNICS